MADTIRDDSFEPTSHTVCEWPNRVMGFDPTGGTKVQPADVNYDRTPEQGNSSKGVITGPTK
jgi:hypothetical protein